MYNIIPIILLYNIPVGFIDVLYMILSQIDTGDFMKKVPSATCVHSIEWVYTPRSEILFLPLLFIPFSTE